MYLVINLGLKSIRGIVFNQEGKQIYTTSRAVYSNLIDHKVEQDSREWKIKLENILTEISSIDYLNGKIEYITSTTSSSCIFGIDDKGNPLTKVMMVSDKRAYKEAQEIETIINSQGEKSIVNCPESSIISKALWAKRNNPEVFSEVKCWIGAGEFLNYYFTEEVFTDTLNASKGFFNDGNYHEDLINNVGLDVNTLPIVREMGYELPVVKKIKTTFNLSPKCKYILTPYDAICAVVGSFDGDKKTACDVSGTVTSVRVLSDHGLNAGKGLILSQKLGNHDKFLIGASNNLGGGIIEWLKQAFYNEADKNVYYIMENNAHEISIGAHGILFLPYMLGERAPFKNANAKGSFFGVNRSSTIKEFTRAVFESTAFVSNDLLKLITSNGLDIESMTVSGGLARFDLINQIKADVTNKRIKVIENFESTSVGAFILMMISLNRFNSIEEAASKIIKIRKIINPSEDNHKVYHEFFMFYKKLNERLLPMYNDHYNLRKQIKSFASETISNL